MPRRLPYPTYPNGPDREYPSSAYDAGYTVEDDPYPQYVLDIDLDGALAGLNTKYAHIDPITHLVLDGNGNPVSGTSAVASINGLTGVVVLTADAIGDGTSYKTMTTAERTKLAGIPTNAYLLSRANHTGTQLASTISDFTTAVQALGVAGGGTITSVNGDLGDDTGAVVISLNSLPDVNVAVQEFDEDGVLIPDTGMQDGDVLTYDQSTNEVINKPITGFAPEGWIAPYTLRGIALAAGDTIPADLPDDAVIFDETKPTTPLIEQINIVTASGTSLTLPSPLVATIHDVTLTGTCAITFPTPITGTRFRLLLRQDATGSRAPTWPSAPKWNGGTPPTLTTTAGAENILDFASISGSSWRQIGSMMSYSAGTTAGPTPTVRGSAFTANSGSSNTPTSVSSTLPTGITSGDILYLLVTSSGTAGALTSNPAINGVALVSGDKVEGPIAGASQTFWLWRKSLAGTESGQTITSGVMTSNVRPSLTGIVIHGAAAVGGETIVSATKAAISTSLVIPTDTPTVANSLLVCLTGFRSSASTTAQAVSPGAISTVPWIQRAEHYEGRLDGTNVNFGGYCQTFALTGNANVSQTSTNGSYTVAANERSYIIAVPPPVS